MSETKQRRGFFERAFFAVTRMAAATLGDSRRPGGRRHIRSSSQLNLNLRQIFGQSSSEYRFRAMQRQQPLGHMPLNWNFPATIGPTSRKKVTLEGPYGANFSREPCFSLARPL